MILSSLGSSCLYAVLCGFGLGLCLGLGSLGDGGDTDEGDVSADVISEPVLEI